MWTVRRQGGYAPAMRVIPSLALACALLVGPPSIPARAAPPKAKKLVEAYFKAKKDKDRAKAWAAIEAAPPLDMAQFAEARDAALKLMAKRGRKLTGGGEWFDDKKDPWKGRYLTSGKGKLGLVLGLHGGGKGSGDAGGAQSGLSGAIGSQKLRGLYPEVLVKTEYGWTDPVDTEKWVLELLRAARRTWKLDPNRIYVSGHSMGGYGTWTYGSIHADLFAAGAAFAGAPTVYWKIGRKDQEAEGVMVGYLPSLRNMPLFCYQSLDDPNVPAAANVYAAAAMKKLREADPEGWEFVYEEVDGRGHAYPKKGPKPGIEWMASHVRDPRPKKIVWQPVRDWKHTFYWLRWDDPWLTSELTATVDAAANSIDVAIVAPRSATPTKTEAERAGKVEALSIYVDERLVDMEREIVLRVDGVERFRGPATPSLVELVRSAEEREDREYVFPARIRVGPAPPPK